MNFYTAGAKMLKSVDKLQRQYENANCDISKEDIEHMVLNRERAAMRYGIMLAMAYKEECINAGVIEDKSHKNTYMITIRPECNKIPFLKFKDDVENFLQRTMFKTIIHCSFEQKGTSHNTLGHGFHVHIIAETTCRSKGEVLRNTISSFKHCTASNCIQVDLCKNPEETKQHYLIDYESKDGHKMITKEWDDKWRESWASPIKSDEGPQIIMLN